MKPTSLIVSIFLGLSLMRGGGAQVSAPPPTAHGVVYVGILDDAREEVLDWKPGVAKDRLIRPAFERTTLGWRKVDYSSLPKQMTWTIAFSGKDIGQVTSANPKGTPNPRVHILTPYQFILSPTKEVPTIGSASDKFAPMGMGPTKARRPLVVVSKPNFADPDGWKRAQALPPEVAALIRAQFRKDFPHVDRCKDEKIIKRDWSFPDSALSFPVSYRANNGGYLVEANLNAGDCGYIDDPSDALSQPWFFVSKDHYVRHFGSFLYWLDAGDYDNDGRSEIIFGLNQPEDTDGFILYDADLNERARLTWSYH